MKTKFLLFMVASICLVGCFEDRFRYQCQDPKNWASEECKPPICTAAGTCPEMLVKPEQEKK